MASGPGISGAISSELLIVALIVLILARRTYRQLTGAPFSASRLFGFAGFYILLFALLAATTLVAAVVTWGTVAFALLAPYLAIPVLAAILTAPYVRRVVRFDRRSDGQWYYRLSWHIPVVYLALFVSRIGAEIVIYGPSGALPSIPPPAPPSGAVLWVLVAVDLLFALSLGLLVGRGIGVYRAHKDLPVPAISASRGADPPLPGD